MDLTLSSENFNSDSTEQKRTLETRLQNILDSDYQGNPYTMLSNFQRTLADNGQRKYWAAIHDKLKTLFMCGSAVPLDGPTVGIPIAIRDSDFFQTAAKALGRTRSTLASMEVMATAWNATLADTGLWMGKTFEPVSEQTVREACDNDPDIMANFEPKTTRIGRNYFRQPPEPDAIQSIALPVLDQLWHLQSRPLSEHADGFRGTLLATNLAKEQVIPYSKTGGLFLAAPGESVVPEMQHKKVYQLNYRWPNLNPVFPMTLLIDELVQIAEGVYLGQLVYATKHFSLGSIDLPFIPGEHDIELGEPYAPNKHTVFESVRALITGHKKLHAPDYGYQNNGYFLLMDPAYADRIYADDAFPQIRPRTGETGYQELGYDQLQAKSEKLSRAVDEHKVTDWANDWNKDEVLFKKFTTLITEPSPKTEDGDVHQMRQENESILQMLQRFSNKISAQTKHEDHLAQFEPLHQLFRSGVAPTVNNGLFQSQGRKGFNIRINGCEVRDWYGEAEVTRGFDYYHGANLNLHWGFAETFCPEREANTHDITLLPSMLSHFLLSKAPRGPNIMNMVWHSIGKYIFPWAGKSYEQISPRKLSMLLDESPDLEQRYPQRVAQLKHHLASAPHYALVKKNRDNYWQRPGIYAEHLNSGSWDQGMSDEDKAFWKREANEHWVMGYNLQDKRIVLADALMRMADINYREPELLLQRASEASGSPFARQGYCFLGVDERSSILPMNSSKEKTKRVFQFHYRYPLIGGPVPIGFCLDELVQIADGLFLGQLIYATALDVPFHSAVAASEYKYQLFGYFLLLDDDWERHRQAIKLDTLD